MKNETCHSERTFIILKIHKIFTPYIKKFAFTIFLSLFPQTAVLLLRIDDIVSGSKKGSEDGGGGGGQPMME